MSTITEIIKFFEMQIGHFSDRSARWLFQNREFLRGLFEILAPPLVPRIDFSQLKLIERSFLADNLEELVADLVFQVPFRDESGTDELFIYILVEHQSTVDKKMAFRVLSYMVNILALQRREWATNNVPESQQRYSPVIPIVFYTGERRWNAPLTLDAIMDVPDILSRFVPKFDILLLDVKGTEPDTLTETGHPLGWLLTVLQKENADEVEIKNALIRAISHLNTLGEEHQEQWEMAIVYLLLLILHRRPDEQHDNLKTVVEEQIPLSHRKEVTEMVYSRADRLLDEGAKRGREEGIKQGIEQGTEPARTTIAITMFNSTMVQLKGRKFRQRLKSTAIWRFYSTPINPQTGFFTTKKPLMVSYSKVGRLWNTVRPRFGAEIPMFCFSYRSLGNKPN